MNDDQDINYTIYCPHCDWTGYPEDCNENLECPRCGDTDLVLRPDNKSATTLVGMIGRVNKIRDTLTDNSLANHAPQITALKMFRNFRPF